MARVRPSSLALAACCRRAPYLSAKYQESLPVTRFGSAVDRQVSLLLSKPDAELPDGEEILPEADLLLKWVAATYPASEWEWYPQLRVELEDPCTPGEILTAGTLDLLCRHRVLPKIVIVDWKKKGQMWAGHLPPPDANPQQRAYLAGAWLKCSRERPIEGGEIVLACWDEKGVTPLRNLEPITGAVIMQIVEEVRAVPPVDLDGPQPEASVGEHCGGCYQRMHCDAHLLPAAVVLQSGLPRDGFSEDKLQKLVIDADTIADALCWLDRADDLIKTAKVIRERVQENVDAYVAVSGPVTVGEMTYGPVETTGRRCGATVATLEKEGLQRLIRPGKKSVKYQWYPRPKKALGAQS